MINTKLKTVCSVTISTIPVLIFWPFFKNLYRAESPQVKQHLVSSITNLVHDFPHRLPNDLRLSILENYEILEKCQVWVERSPSIQSCFQKLNFHNDKQKTRKIRY